mmetsp:Transcript_20952/g.52652  ORF Transcript_20952/g.52652 Transcript_20952/m.52652 type:complete len:220 (-) Transcript_20952:340-999(-)
MGWKKLYFLSLSAICIGRMCSSYSVLDTRSITLGCSTMTVYGYSEPSLTSSAPKESPETKMSAAALAACWSAHCFRASSVVSFRWKLIVPQMSRLTPPSSASASYLGSASSFMLKALNLCILILSLLIVTDASPRKSLSPQASLSHTCTSTQSASYGTSIWMVQSHMGWSVSLMHSVIFSVVPILTVTKGSEVPVESAAAMLLASTMLATIIIFSPCCA